MTDLQNMMVEEFDKECNAAITAYAIMCRDGDWPSGWDRERYKAVNAELLRELRAYRAMKRRAEVFLRAYACGNPEAWAIREILAAGKEAEGK